jgi:SAM-dependent methyltransferase
MPTFAVREPLVRWLRTEARSAHDALGPYRLLDVGCGEKPYRDLFASYASEHVGVDPVANPSAELQGPIEALPVADASFDVVLCAQVLEHVDDPAQAVCELARVVRPGGRVLLSTHGVYVFHPNPTDHWRWTHTGLEKLLQENGEWASVRVTPGAGTAASLTMLNAIYIEHVLRRTPLRFLRRPVVAAMNRAGRAFDRRVPQLSEPRPGTLAANYHVVAERAR